MLTVNRIIDNHDEVITLLKKRGEDFTGQLNKIVATDKKRKATQGELDDLLAESNKISKEIGELFKSGKAEEANALKDRSTVIKGQSSELKEKLNGLENDLRTQLYNVPNIPHELVPEGNDDTQNEIVKENGKQVNLGEGAKPHWELTEQYNLIDFELGVKITGAGFPVYRGKGAKLQRAIINFFLDSAASAGYEEVIPPLVVNEASGYGTGQLPDKEGQMYHVTAEDLYLIPTAEVPITNIYRDVILDSGQMPVKNCGYTPCFRREAGSYGKDVRGLNRLHQFDKVEIVQVTHPDKSYETLDAMVSYVSGLLDQLDLPYRIARLCGGDLGFTSALTYDMEVYSAGQDKWLEVSSISNFESYQANRLKLRYRDEENKPQLAHTLNGSALALPRIMASLIENNQTAEGIKVPDCLVKYTGFDIIN